jgi:hypothetical protein
MSKSILKIHLDETVKDSDLFKSKMEFEICKPEIFKYGVMVEEVPIHIVDSDFDYLQSKIPAYELLHSDFINVQLNHIENLSKDDRKKKTISEIIGVAFGIKYTVELLKTNPNKFKKIGVPTNGKYLDYSLIVDNLEYELETKGTVSKNYNRFKNDILDKKKSKSLKNVFLRFGTIAMINNPGEIRKSQCVVVDDPPDSNNKANEDNSFEIQLLNYAMFLSYILDSKYYNKFIKPLKTKKFRRIRINQNKFFTKYEFKGKIYLGECFDYRLIRDDLDTLKQNNINDLFQYKTEKYGRNKFFIGLENTVIDAINSRDEDFLREYKSEWFYTENRFSYHFLDRDGIIIVKSKNGQDKQLEQIFTEEEVKARLGASFNERNGLSHKCGAPCRSREIEGKPCEIRTYRKSCHFHR